MKVKYAGLKIVIFRYALRLKIHAIEGFVGLKKVISERQSSRKKSFLVLTQF